VIVSEGRESTVRYISKIGTVIARKAEKSVEGGNGSGRQ
jgi:hypothetical protein